MKQVTGGVGRMMFSILYLHHRHDAQPHSFIPRPPVVLRARQVNQVYFTSELPKRSHLLSFDHLEKNVTQV